MAQIQDKSTESDSQGLSEKEPLVPKVSVKDDDDDVMFYKKIKPYQVYTLILFLVTYLLNQLDRYMLAITVQPMAQEIHFGDKGCLTNSSFTKSQLGDVKCNGTTQDACGAIAINVTSNGTDNVEFVCKWDYNGQGIEYQLIAGPVFIVIYTFAGIFISFAADKYNRKMMLAGCLIWWSVMTLLTGFVNKYWQLALLRFGLGLGEAGCTPFVASMMADIFPADLRGTALGIYNWGIYMGYSMSYALGNTITNADINGQGWRWAFFISGIPGILVGILLFITVQEPERTTGKATEEKSETIVKEKPLQRLVKILKPFLAPSLILAVLAGSVRNAAGYVFAYNTQPYFTAIGQTKEQIAQFMGWIPIVGGSLGVLVGGFISDRVVKGTNKQTKISQTGTFLIWILNNSSFAAGYVFAYNTQPYFTAIGQTKEQIAQFMGWIPIVGGSLGVLVGGFISDRVVKGRGIYARVAIIIASLLIAAPFAAGTLFLSPPGAYIMQIPCYLFGEMWIGITLAIVVELVPSTIRTSAVAVYLFIISNIGGNMPLLVPVIREAFENNGATKAEALRGALYILYPALYVVGAVIFIPAMFSMKRDAERVQDDNYVRMVDHASKS